MPGDAPDSSPCTPDYLCVYDGNPPETYITPADYWSAPDGIARTEAVADTGFFDYLHVVVVRRAVVQLARPPSSSTSTPWTPSRPSIPACASSS